MLTDAPFFLKLRPPSLVSLLIVCSGRTRRALCSTVVRSFHPPTIGRKAGGVQINTSYYSKIHPGRSLLLYDCGKKSPWCNQAEFGFSASFSKAAKLSSNPPDTAASDWYQSAASALGTFKAQVAPWDGKSLANNPFQTLAVVNRMDLAHWSSDKKWSGLSCVVYGPKPNGSPARVPPLTLILEFVLPPMDGPSFRAMAQDWFDLSTKGGARLFPNSRR